MTRKIERMDDCYNDSLPVPEGVVFKAADALCEKWNLHYPDAVRMATVVLAQQPAVHPAITHCDNCGCDWLDNGLNPIGCPYCKQDDAAAQGGGEAKWCEIHQHYKPCEHTAPPSVPVGVEGLIKDWESDLAEDKRDGVPEVAIRVQEIHIDQLRALAQQSTAVYGAYPTPRNRVEAVALARLALAYLGVIDAHIDAAIARCETELDTQTGGSDNDR